MAVGRRTNPACTALISILLVTAAGCGGSASPTVPPEQSVSDNVSSAGNRVGPRLGDDCTAELTNATEVEVSTVRGPLECREARGLLKIYSANAAQHGSGTGGALDIGVWRCKSATPTEQPRAGQCEQRAGAPRMFEVYTVGFSFRAGNNNLDCHIPPPDGAGQYNLRATNIDCGAAERILDLWTTRCAGSRIEACVVEHGVSCRIVDLGYELSQIRCRGRRNQLVTFETGA